MTDELKNKLTERFEYISGDVDCNKDIKDALLKAYLAGGEYGYECAAEKAYKFVSKCIWGRCVDKFKSFMGIEL